MKNADEECDKAFICTTQDPKMHALCTRQLATGSAAKDKSDLYQANSLYA